MESVIDADRQASREAFEAKLAEIGWQGEGHDRRWLEGPPEEVILDQKDSDLIVLGTHGRTGLAAALFGNVAYGVLKRSSVPVLAVRLPKHRWRMGS
jgi:nucleotide-binding universal stress UspA family protein